MAKKSAGILAYRNNAANGLQVLLVHPGGPFYLKKDQGVWSMPKGEYETNEDPLQVALREFTEETGNNISNENLMPLTPIKTSYGKLITVWAVESDFEQCFISSNQFTMEWPPKSGRQQSFDEVDDAKWFNLPEARLKINQGQVPILNQLEQLLKK